MKRRPQFLKVAAARVKWATPGLVLQTRPIGDGEAMAGAELRVGFTVTRKVGGAVVRNRVKRRLRAVVQEVMTEGAKGGRDYVVIGRKGAGARPFGSLVGDMEHALRRLDCWQGPGS